MGSQQRFPASQAGGGADQNDVTVAVPANTEWELQSVHATLVSTATVGNRQLKLQIRDDADNVVYEVAAPATQAASLTVGYSFAPDATREAQLANDVQSAPVPAMVLGPGWDIRVFDDANVDVLDDLTLRLAVRRGGSS